MKEYTVTMNAQITCIFKEGTFVDEETIKFAMDKMFSDFIKTKMNADDVVVSDLKLFIRDKENSDGK